MQHKHKTKGVHYGSTKFYHTALLTLLELKSREYWAIPIAGKKSEDVTAAFNELKAAYSEHFSKVFKTITTDNGSEFAELSAIEKASETLVYYAHPYIFCEKGSNERHNRILRRFIPKGKRIDDYTCNQISDIEVWCNSLPRKILNYKTPDEIFEAEPDRIYSLTAV